MKTSLIVLGGASLFALGVGCSTPDREATESSNDSLTTTTVITTPRFTSLDEPRALETLDQPTAHAMVIVPNTIDCGVELHFPSLPTEGQIYGLRETMMFDLPEYPSENVIVTYDKTKGTLSLTFPTLRSWSANVELRAVNPEVSLAKTFRNALGLDDEAPIGTATIVACPDPLFVPNAK